MDEWQTEKTQMRRRILRRLIWVYTVCSGPSVRIHMVNTVTLDQMLFFFQSKSIDIFLISPQKHVVGTH